MILPEATRGAALVAIKEAFQSAGLTDASLEARDLMLFVLRCDRAVLADEVDTPLTEAERAQLQTAVSRRLHGTPLDWIMRWREFMGRRFEIGPDTLSPREDSAAVVELARRFMLADRPSRFLDLGTGSGILLLTLLAEYPLASGVGTDIAPGALSVAAANAAALGLATRAKFIESNWFERAEGHFDLVVSNPPYIESAVIPTLEREVREHDPWRALDGGADGLDAYRAIAAATTSRLAAGGVIVVEIGQGQAEAVRSIFSVQGLLLEDRRRDLAGIERVLAFTVGR